MGNSNGTSINQSLLQSNNQVHDNDVSLIVNDQSSTVIKKIFAIKNPVNLKRNSLLLERDSDERHLFYIVFVYDAVTDMNVNIYFNARRNIFKSDNNLKLKDVEVNTSSTKLLIAKEKYIPGSNFKNQTLKIENCVKGQNKKFFDKNAKIDMKYFNQYKEDFEDSFDIVIEFIPIFQNENNSNTKIKSANESNSEIMFYTLGRIISDSDESLFRIRTELQRLFTQSMWFDIYEVFNSALETGECLICCCNIRNTLFLPCKHSCSCQSCAHSLRMRNNPCPICKNSIDDLVIIDTEETSQNNYISA